jgi:hypothetical protein
VGRSSGKLIAERGLSYEAGTNEKRDNKNDYELQ